MEYFWLVYCIRTEKEGREVRFVLTNNDGPRQFSSLTVAEEAGEEYICNNLANEYFVLGPTWSKNT